MTPITQLVTSKKELVPTSNKLTSYEIRLRALEIAKGLTCTTAPNDMTAWYCKAFKTLGESKYTALAKMAFVEGQPRKKLFGWLLREELNKIAK